ncbi:MAG TPA: hypothetical protein VGH28_01995 [Polyangiaceae bacterium]
MKRGILAGLAMLAAASCANGEASPPPGPGGGDGGGGSDTGVGVDGSPSGDGSTCDGPCDTDHDGVPDTTDKCPGTPQGAKVNKVGCADSQLTAKVESTFPPYGLTWTPGGDLGRAGGLTWTYTGIQRADLFHIWWIVGDDPAYPYGVSLDGPIDVPGEHWQYSATDSDLPNGKLVFTNTTGILLADSSTRPLSGRLTMNIVDDTNAPIAFADVATLGVTAQDGKYGAEIKGTAFKVTALIEVEDTITNTWTPYLDYYDAATTVDTGDAGPDGGGNTYVSYGGSFYDK